jgi:rSAM/selenodomain-associated transferase 2
VRHRSRPLLESRRGGGARGRLSGPCIVLEEDPTRAHTGRPAGGRIPEGSGTGNAAAGTRGAGDLGVVVPALDEADTIDLAVRSVQRLGGSTELVVVDGGSRDGTPARARAAGARVILSPAGRGRQMNAGARATRAATLLFLHADCVLPADAPRAVREVLDRGCGAGLFPVRFDWSHPLLRLVGALSHLESRWTSFGDGALFVRRDVFEAVGGFPDWPLFEDVEMLARLRRTTRVGKARGVVVASARRYRAHGVWRQQGRVVGLFALRHLGVSPERLARAYGNGGDERRTGARPLKR